MTQKELLKKYFPNYNDISIFEVPRAIIEHGQNIISYVLIQRRDKELCKWLVVVTKVLYGNSYIKEHITGKAEVVRELFDTFDIAIEGASQFANIEVNRIEKLSSERNKMREKEDKEWKALEEYEKVLDSRP